MGAQRKVLITLRKKPTPPKRVTSLRFEELLFEGATFAEIMERLGCTDPTLIQIETRYCSDGGFCDVDETDVYARYERPMTDAEFRDVVAKYEKEKHKYDEWYKKNRKLITAENRRRKEQTSAKKQRDLNSQRAVLLRELAKLDKISE